MVSHQERLSECVEAFSRFEDHIKESKAVRDRLVKCEIEIQVVKDGVLKNAIIGGIIGALVGSGAAPAVTRIVGVFIK